MTPPFTLRRHYPSEVEYRVADDGTTSPVQLEASYTISVGHNTDNPLDWRVALTVQFSGKAEAKELVKGKVTFVGYFNITDTIPDAERQNYAARNGGGILYSAARELIANISARSPHMLITLPVASFASINIDPATPRVQLKAARPN